MRLPPEVNNVMYKHLSIQLAKATVYNVAHFQSKNWKTMSPLSCAHRCACKGRETSANKETWSTRKCFIQKLFAHISYMTIQIQMSSGKILHKRNFMHTQA